LSRTLHHLLEAVSDLILKPKKGTKPTSVQNSNESLTSRLLLRNRKRLRSRDANLRKRPRRKLGLRKIRKS